MRVGSKPRFPHGEWTMPQTHVSNNQGFHYPQFRVNPTLGAIQTPQSGAHASSPLTAPNLGAAAYGAARRTGDKSTAGALQNGGTSPDTSATILVGARKAWAHRSKRQILGNALAIRVKVRNRTIQIHSLAIAIFVTRNVRITALLAHQLVPYACATPAMVHARMAYQCDRQRGDRFAPAKRSDERGLRVGVWQTGLDGLDWIEEVARSKGYCLRGNGYPCRYTAQARDLLPPIMAAPPRARKPWHHDPAISWTPMGGPQPH
jgi:hypothetical protein